MTKRYTLGNVLDELLGVYWILDRGEDTAATSTLETINHIGDACAIHGGSFFGGMFHGGEFNGGEFRAGIFTGGMFYGGVFYDGIYHGGVYHDGEFYNGEFIDGNFYDGYFYDGTFHDGIFHNGAYYDGACPEAMYDANSGSIDYSNVTVYGVVNSIMRVSGELYPMENCVDD